MFDETPCLNPEEIAMAGEWVNSPRMNRILACLPVEEYGRHVDAMEFVLLKRGEVLFDCGDKPAFVYFPTSSLISLTSTTESGSSAELAMTGNDGLVGTTLILGGKCATHKAVVQSAGGAYRLRADAMRFELGQGGHLLQLSLRYIHALMTQMAQSLVCNRHHSLDQRLCRWLLLYLDRQPGDKLLVTHQLIAHMLGVRREAVTEAAGKLQAAGLIQYSRGYMVVINRPGLEARVCECYRAVKTEYERLFDEMPEPAPARGHPPGPTSLRHAYEDAQAMLRKYTDIYNFAPVGYFTLNASRAILKLNLAGAILLGIKHSQCGQHRFDAFVKPEYLADLQQFQAEVLGGKCRGNCEVVLTATDKRPEALVRIEAAPDDNGRELHMVVIDITAEKTLHEREQYQRALLDNCPFMVWLKDKESRFLAVNAPFAHTFGWPSAEALEGRTDYDLTSRELADAYRADDRAVMASGEKRSFEEQIEMNGALRWFETFKSPVVVDGRNIGTVGFSRDITERRRMEAELRSLAATDSLTQLANRRHFLARLEETHADLLQDADHPVAVLMFDLDHFKSINDSLGHAAGDAVLRLFSSLLRDELRAGDLAGRIGGEEFAVLLTRSNPDAAAAFAERIRRKVAETSILMDQRRIAITVSIGIALMLAEDTTAEQALGRADDALYRAKAEGRNRIALAETPPPQQVFRGVQAAM